MLADARKLGKQRGLPKKVLRLLSRLLTKLSLLESPPHIVSQARLMTVSPALARGKERKDVGNPTGCVSVHQSSPVEWISIQTLPRSPAVCECCSITVAFFTTSEERQEGYSFWPPSRTNPIVYRILMFLRLVIFLQVYSPISVANIYRYLSRSRFGLRGSPSKSRQDRIGAATTVNGIQGRRPQQHENEGQAGGSTTDYDQIP